MITYKLTAFQSNKDKNTIFFDKNGGEHSISGKQSFTKINSEYTILMTDKDVFNKVVKIALSRYEPKYLECGIMYSNDTILEKFR